MFFCLFLYPTKSLEFYFLSFYNDVEFIKENRQNWHNNAIIFKVSETVVVLPEKDILFKLKILLFSKNRFRYTTESCLSYYLFIN